jgi:hypothetical protein
MVVKLTTACSTVLQMTLVKTFYSSGPFPDSVSTKAFLFRFFFLPVHQPIS